jgi:hypothetical protein
MRNIVCGMTLAVFLSGCSAVTNYRKYEFFLDN